MEQKLALSLEPYLINSPLLFSKWGQLTKGKILYVKDKICQVRVLKDVPVVSDLTKMDFKLTLFNPISDIRLMYTPT